jgi:hypothetical protein
MLRINQRFGRHRSCHLQGECVVGRVLEALYRASRRWRVRFDGADWWRGGVGRYPMGEEHVGFLLHIELQPRKPKDKLSQNF